MPKNLNDYIKALPKKNRLRIQARTEALLDEEASLQNIRKALGLPQAQVARHLRVNQAAISKMERRGDMNVSTLRSFIEAMGGSLELVVQFPGSPPVRISPL